MDKSLVNWNSMRKWGAAAFTGVVTFAVGGCGEAEFPVARVHGTITVEGKPLAGGRVMFAPQPKSGNINPGKPAYGRLDEKGYFELTTYAEGDGAVIGTHLITITAPRDAAEGEKPAFRSLLVPNAIEVCSNDVNQVEISLTADDVAKYAS